jgi:hypothetical protein
MSKSYEINLQNKLNYTVVPRYSESLGTQVSIHYNEVSQ